MKRRGRREIPVAERIIKYFDRPEEGCWEWFGAKRGGGYGTIWIGGRKGRHHPAHRIVYEVMVGPIPKGLLVLHLCDNKCCVRPEHLYVGTTADNAHDAVASGVWPSKKGRAVPWAIGERNANARLTENSVREIRRLSAQGVSGRSLARMMDINKTTIQRILHGKSWAHVH